VGQDLAATGGLDDYTDGYCDHFAVPAGVTTYTGFSPGSQSYSLLQRGNDGIESKVNWGAGDICAQCYLDDPDFRHSVLAIGLSMVGHERAVARGKRDYLIEELGEWIKGAGRPVFLRIGYEFDGWDWNHYDRKDYLGAWKRIHAKFLEMDVDNVAFVWQSKGYGSDQEVLEAWYPGDALVDWCAYSYFADPDEEMLAFARKHGKPVFIAEATPVLREGDQFVNTDLSDPAIARRAWAEWFEPFFATLHDNADVIKAFSYINVDWPVQPMWVENLLFRHVDSRIQESAYITERWRAEMAKERYLRPTAELWIRLQ
jgi:hypothetical protein